MLKKHKTLLLSIIIIGVSGIVGFLLKQIDISIEWYKELSANPVFITVSVLPFVGCVVFGIILGKKYYKEHND